MHSVQNICAFGLGVAGERCVARARSYQEVQSRKVSWVANGVGEK